MDVLLMVNIKDMENYTRETVITMKDSFMMEKNMVAE